VIEAAELGRPSLKDPECAATAVVLSGLMVAIGDAVAFRHALLRETFYGEIAESRRPGLHHPWGDMLLVPEQAGAISGPAELARHLRRARADAQAMPQLARPAANARNVGASRRVWPTPRRRWPSRRTARLWLELADLGRHDVDA